MASEENSDNAKETAAPVPFTTEDQTVSAPNDQPEKAEQNQLDPESKDPEDNGKITEAPQENQTVTPQDTALKPEATTESEARNSTQTDERKAQDSLRVEEARKYNNRDRHTNNGRAHFKSKQRKNKFDPASETKSSDPAEIRKQVEFYFSDSNLLTDKFLFTKVDGHKNIPVPIEVIHSFKRMRRFEPRSAVIEALKESKVLNVVEDDTAIQRKEALPEGLVGKPMDELQKVQETSSMARSVYVKGFGDEESQTQFEIEAFFANYGPTNSVRLRRVDDGSFKGSVFVEFDSEGTQKAFLNLETKPKWNGKELLVKSKKEYCDQVLEDIKAGKRSETGKKQFFKKPGYDNKKRHDFRNGENARDWRQRREEDRENGFKDKSGKFDRGKKGSKGSGQDQDQDQGPPKSQKDADDGEVEMKNTDPMPSETVDEQSETPIQKAGTTEDQTTSAPIEPTPTQDESSSRKRGLEDDEGEAETQGKEKKVDTKEA